MNRNTIHLLAALLLTPLAVMAGADQPRTKELFDFDWRFALNDQPGAEQPGFDDAKCRAVDLPHDFSIEGPFVGSKEEKELAYNGFRRCSRAGTGRPFKQHRS